MIRKIANVSLILLLLFGLTACNTKSPSDTSQPTVTYTKEFSYLPTYKNMEFQSITQTPQNQSIAKYLIKNTTTEKVLTEYGDILKEDGWTENWSYTKDKKPASLIVQKDNHTVALLPQQNKSDVILTINGSL
jgi:hypothetical protein